jgi:hypothetical protein
MLTGLTACSDNGDTGRSRRRSHEATEIKVDIEDLKTYDGPMLVITSTIQGPIPVEEERDHSVVIYYDGTVNYLDASPNECLGALNDEDYMTVYNFCIDTVRNDTFADYYEEVCDGQTYSFVFYDVDGDQHVLYDGCMYENAELNAILDMFY